MKKSNREKLPETLTVKMKSADLVSVMAEEPNYIEWVSRISLDKRPAGCTFLCALFGIDPEDLRYAIYQHMVEKAKSAA